MKRIIAILVITLSSLAGFSQSVGEISSWEHSSFAKAKKDTVFYYTKDKSPCSIDSIIELINNAKKPKKKAKDSTLLWVIENASTYMENGLYNSNLKQISSKTYNGTITDIKPSWFCADPDCIYCSKHNTVSERITQLEKQIADIDAILKKIPEWVKEGKSGDRISTTGIYLPPQPVPAIIQQKASNYQEIDYPTDTRFYNDTTVLYEGNVVEGRHMHIWTEQFEGGTIWDISDYKKDGTYPGFVTKYLCKGCLRHLKIQEMKKVKVLPMPLTQYEEAKKRLDNILTPKPTPK